MPPPKGSFNPLEGPGDYTVTSTVHNDTYPAISPTNFDFTGKTIFISGGSRGLGHAITLSFARAGASQIAVGARSSLSTLEKDIQTAATSAGRKPPKFLALKFDVTNQEDVENAAKTVEKEFGKCDIVINNAGVLYASPIIESDPDQWWNTFNVNLRGPYLVARAFLPLLLKGGDKTICTVSSVGAFKKGPGLSSYQTSKLAVLRFSEFVDAEYADQGVLSFCIHPGNILTDMLNSAGELDDAWKAIFTETPEISGDTIVYLTAEKRQWLGGRYINVTWDMPELMSKKDAIVKGDKLRVKLDVDF